MTLYKTQRDASSNPDYSHVIDDLGAQYDLMFSYLAQMNIVSPLEPAT